MILTRMFITMMTRMMMMMMRVLLNKMMNPRHSLDLIRQRLFYLDKKCQGASVKNEENNEEKTRISE